MSLMSLVTWILAVCKGSYMSPACVGGVTQVAWCTGGGRGCMLQRRHLDWGRTQFTLVECPSSGIVVGIVDGPTSRAPLSSSVGVVMVGVC